MVLPPGNTRIMRRIAASGLTGILFFVLASRGYAQSLGNAGTVAGTVVDPSGAAVPKATITVHNALTNYTQRAISGEDGSFRLINLPPNPYHLEVTAPGFEPYAQDVDVRNSLPIQLKATL